MTTRVGTMIYAGDEYEIDVCVVTEDERKSLEKAYYILREMQEKMRGADYIPLSCDRDGHEIILDKYGDENGTALLESADFLSLFTL